MEEILIGSVDRSILIFISDPASTDGGGKVGVAHTDITVSGTRVKTDNDVIVTDYTSSLNALTNLTDAHNDWGWKEVSATLAPGLYRLDVADALYATGAWYAVVQVTITSSLASATPKAFRLVSVNADDGVHFGLSAIPNASPASNGGLGTVDASNRVKADLDTIKTQTVTCAAGVTVSPFVGNATAAIGVNASGHVSRVVLTDTTTTVTNQLTAAQIATGVWQDSTAGDFTTASSIGKALYIANIVPGASGGHFIAGSNAATTVNITGNITGNLSGSVGSISGITFPTNFADLAISSGGGRVSALLVGAAGTEFTFNGTFFADNLLNFFEDGGAFTSARVSNVKTVADKLAGTGAVTFASLTVSGATTLTGAITATNASNNLTLGTFTASMTGSVGSVTGGINTGSGVITTLDALDTAQDTQHGTTQTAVADVPTNAELATALITALTTALTEGYRGTGATGSVRDLLYELLAHVGEFTISGTTKTLKKIDGSTTAKTSTLNDATTPTGITETT